MIDVYAKLDKQLNIIAIAGGASAAMVQDDFMKIDSGSGERFYHCQSQYLPELMTESGAFKYRYINGEIVENIVENVESAPQPSQLDRIEAQLMYTALMTDTLIEGV